MRLIDADALEEKIANHTFNDSFRVGDFNRIATFEMTKGDIYKILIETESVDINEMFCEYLNKNIAEAKEEAARGEDSTNRMEQIKGYEMAVNDIYSMLKKAKKRSVEEKA